MLEDARSFLLKSVLALFSQLLRVLSGVHAAGVIGLSGGILGLESAEVGHVGFDHLHLSLIC